MTRINADKTAFEMHSEASGILMFITAQSSILKTGELTCMIAPWRGKIINST